MATPTAVDGSNNPVGAFSHPLNEDYIFLANGGVIANTTIQAADTVPPVAATPTTQEMIVNHGGGIVIPPGVLSSTPSNAAAANNQGNVSNPLPTNIPGAVAPHILLAQQPSDDPELELENQEDEQEVAETTASEGLTPWCKPGKLYSMDVIG